ncbi:hypothetical protein N7475_003402 [Penicillium sp. IBT 31633x]|nr:hypothetical protein N7475_003402 [Penicillium sp. IBT 31633x]
MASTPLTKFPGDCWLQILEYLSQRDLYNLSLTSRDIRASAEPFLYRSIHWDWKYPPFEKIMLFLRSISERPELADLVWHVSLVWWDVETAGEEVPLPKANVDWAKASLRYRPTARWARKIIRDANFPVAIKHTLSSRLATGDAYVYATLLVSQLHNLRSLRLDFSFVLEQGLPGIMLLHSLFGDMPPRVLTRFEKLEMVDYGSNLPIMESNENLHVGRYDHQFLPWFRLPSLRVFEIWPLSLVGICVFPEPLPRPPLHLSNIRSLVLARTLILPQDLAQLLLQAPFLESLHVGTLFKCLASNYLLLEPERLLCSLETSSQTLKHLSISLELPSCCWANFRLRPEYGGRNAPFHGILKKFCALKTLSLPLIFVIGWQTTTTFELQDLLPPNLKALDLRPDLWPTPDLIEFESATLRAFEELMRLQEAGYYPSLTSFSYQGLNENNQDAVQELGLRPDIALLVKRQALRLHCQTKGYEFYFRPSDWAPTFMTRKVIWMNGTIVQFPWPFAHFEGLPRGMPHCFKIPTTADLGPVKRHEPREM